MVAARTGRFYGVKMTGGHIYSIAGQGTDACPACNGAQAAGSWLGPALFSAEPDRAGNIVLAGQDEDFTPDFPTVAEPYVRVIAEAAGTFYGQKMKAGDIYQVAGKWMTGAATYRNAVLGTKTSLWSASDALADSPGNLVIADGPQVRVVAVRSGRFYGLNMKAGFIYRIAGSPAQGYSGDGGRAIRARLIAGAIWLDGFGNVVLGGGNRVRVIAAKTGRFYGQKMTAGDIYTVAGNGSQVSDNVRALAAEFASPAGVSVSNAGDVAFITSFFVFPYGPDISTLNMVPARSGTFFGAKMTAGRLHRVAVNGGRSGLTGAAPLAFDHSGNIVAADANGNKVWLVAAATGTFYGQAMKAGGTYAVAGDGQSGFSGDGGKAAGAMLNGPDGAAVDQHGNVLIVDSANNRVRVLAAGTGTFYGQPMTGGDIYTIAGDGSPAYSGEGGPATAAGMNPMAVATDAAGNLIVTDASQRVLAIAASTGTFYGQAMTAGDVYTIAGDGTSGFAGSGGPAGAAEFGAVGGVTIDAYGNVIFTDTGNNVVWAVPSSTGWYYGQYLTAGDVYVMAGGGTAILGDGGPAISAQLGGLSSAAISADGSLLVSDGADNRIRAIAP